MTASAFPRAPNNLADSVRLLQWFDRIGRRHETTEYTIYKAGSFTRDTTTASGNQSVTGVGFKPKVVAFVMARDNSFAFSVGIDDGTTSICATSNSSVTAGAFLIDTNDAISSIVNGGADVYQGNITSLDSDGFTIAWVKTGTPTATITIGYLALR